MPAVLVAKVACLEGGNALGVCVKGDGRPVACCVHLLYHDLKNKFLR